MVGLRTLPVGEIYSEDLCHLDKIRATVITALKESLHVSYVATYSPNVMLPGDGSIEGDQVRRADISTTRLVL